MGNPDVCGPGMAHPGFPLGLLSLLPGCNFCPSIGPSSLAWVSPSCIRWQTSWLQPESDLLTPPRNQPTLVQEILPLLKEWETAEKERNKTERKKSRGGGRERKEAEEKRRFVKRSKIWWKPQGKTFKIPLYIRASLLCQGLIHSRYSKKKKNAIEIMHLLE